MNGALMLFQYVSTTAAARIAARSSVWLAGGDVGGATRCAVRGSRATGSDCLRLCPIDSSVGLGRHPLRAAVAVPNAARYRQPKWAHCTCVSNVTHFVLRSPRSERYDGESFAPYRE